MAETAIPRPDCGGCTVCCTALPIEADFTKPAGVACRHCTPTGCGIYEKRYAICRGFLCGWLLLPGLDESWRPDRSGILIEYQLLNGVTGVSLLLAGNPLKAVRQTKVIDFVANAVIHNIPIWLSLPGPPGYQGAQNLLNIQPMREAAATSRAKVRELLEVALRRLQNYPFQPYEMTNSGNHVGLGDG